LRHAAIAIPGLDRIGGAERQAMLLAGGLRNRGWRVTVIALSGTGGASAAELQNAGVSFFSLNMRKGLADPRGWVRLNRWLWRTRPDLIHAHLPHASWLARWSRLAAPVPVVVDTLHSSSTGRLGRKIGYLCSRWLPDHVTAVSQATAASHLAARMVGQDELTVLENGIDLQEWRPDSGARARLRHGLAVADEFLWLAVARLDAVKDFPTLLAAMKRLPQNARLAILGDGPLRGELVAMAGQFGIEHRVRFVGFETDVKRWMQAADGFVLASRFEGLPMVLLEAGACALPAVATDVPGTREVIVNGKTGFLARAGDPAALAAGMTRLMTAPLSARHAIGAQARRHLLEHFSIECVLDRWDQLYVELLNREPVSRWARLAARKNLSRQSAASA